MIFQPVYAEDPCKVLEMFAGRVMERRQNGALMSDLIRIIDNGDYEEINDRMMKKIIVSAYDKPLYSTDDYKQKAILQFKNDIYMKCYRSKK